MANKDVSTLLVGCSKISQLDDNIKAISVYKNWNKNIEERIEALLGNTPEPEINFLELKPKVPRRKTAVNAPISRL